jgi:Druantia protein DruA
MEERHVQFGRSLITNRFSQTSMQSGTNYSVTSPMVEMSFLRRLRHACRWLSLAPWKPISSGLQASLGVSLVSRGYGRRMRFLIWDQSNEKLIGLIVLGDPVFNLRVRDEESSQTTGSSLFFRDCLRPPSFFAYLTSITYAHITNIPCRSVATLCPLPGSKGTRHRTYEAQA